MIKLLVFLLLSYSQLSFATLIHIDSGDADSDFNHPFGSALTIILKDSEDGPARELFDLIDTIKHAEIKEENEFSKVIVLEGSQSRRTKIVSQSGESKFEYSFMLKFDTIDSQYTLHTEKDPKGIASTNLEIGGKAAFWLMKYLEKLPGVSITWSRTKGRFISCYEVPYYGMRCTLVKK